MMATEFKYCCTIYGHEADVRSVQASPIPSSSILSASRDMTARLWSENSDGVGFHQRLCFEGHTNFVSCIAAICPSEDYPEGVVFTGSSDKIIRIFLPSSSESVTELKGHTDTVCTLAAGKFRTLISGSWDKTACVWIYSKTESGAIEGKNVLKLEGHTASVWAVLLLQQGVMATGSADKTIKLWKAGKCVQTFKGHEDCVRDLAVISACQFLSCANDATVRRWTTTGECLQVYYGHTNFIYSIAVLPGETGFVTGGEDRTVRVWDLEKKDAVQTIALPGQSAWDVAVLENGDLVVALSDGTMRVFTQSKTRVALDADVAAFETELAESMTQQNDITSQVDEKNIKDVAALTVPGAKDGQVIMVRIGPKIEVHQWSENDVKWNKVGDVISTKNDKMAYNGQEYDFVFDVDIQEGAPTLKLPYNLDEEPWFAAQRFIDQNELSQDFLDEVCTFIMDNSKEARKRTGQQPRSAAVADPLTGEEAVELILIDDGSEIEETSSSESDSDGDSWQARADITRGGGESETESEGEAMPPAYARRTPSGCGRPRKRRRGSRSRSPRIPQFTGEGGVHLFENEDATPYEVFSKYFDNSFFNLVKTNTNKYARQKLRSRSELSEHSILKSWKPVSLSDLRKFFAIIFRMAVVHKPEISHYWSTNIVFADKFCNSLMSRNRFQAILCMLHVCDNDEYIVEGQPGHNRLHKVQPVIDHFDKIFWDSVSPSKNLSIDEGTCPFKGRVKFRVYNPDKPKKWGIKIYELCDSKTGYCIKYKVFAGVNEYSQDKTYHLVLDMCNGLLDKGHHIYMDRFYTSPKLFEEIERRGSSATGTCMSNRHGLPKSVLSPKLNLGELLACKKGNLLALKWKDKRDVLMLSTLATNAMMNVTVGTSQGIRVKRKPCVVQNYNDNMAGVDKSDQLIAYYPVARKTMKWWKKIFFHLVGIGLVNSQKAYNLIQQRDDGQTISLLTFISEIILKLSEHPLEPQSSTMSPTTSLNRLHGRHFPDLVPPTSSQSPMRRCKVCADLGAVKRSRYWCSICEVGLCVSPCFKTYHTVKDYTK